MRIRPLTMASTLFFTMASGVLAKSGDTADRNWGIFFGAYFGVGLISSLVYLCNAIDKKTPCPSTMCGMFGMIACWPIGIWVWADNKCNGKRRIEEQRQQQHDEAFVEVERVIRSHVEKKNAETGLTVDVEEFIKQFYERWREERAKCRGANGGGSIDVTAILEEVNRKLYIENAIQHLGSVATV